MSIAAVPISIGRSSDRPQEEGRRGQLTGKVTDSKVRVVRTQLFDSNGQIDGLEERVRAERVCDCGGSLTPE
jgi:hypothetical protein